MIAIGSTPVIAVASEQDGTSDVPPGTDHGAERDKRPEKPCCKRLPGRHGWCAFVEGHTGDCNGFASSVPGAGESKPASSSDAWSSGKRRLF